MDESETTESQGGSSFLKRNSYKLMIVFTIIQCFLVIGFYLIYFLDNASRMMSLEYKVFISLCLILNLLFSIYFSYHSVSLILYIKT